ncbi:hypothetical protein GGQ85_001071 [Nitrobacter vulgaris]|uniref:hypothetical protein n=1 Tax=Nitrobacter vulgaris TaxID=29421 RepID=UPI00285CEF50|nr:hypothetical protein [Nitrobacter vulgaris]MDR6303388.1 hypothetical protein [Nitrobacter vulgaris]
MTTEARNEALQDRVGEFREIVAPVLLQLIHDLARAEIEVEVINRRVPWASAFGLLSRPSIFELCTTDSLRRY